MLLIGGVWGQAALSGAAGYKQALTAGATSGKAAQAGIMQGVLALIPVAGQLLVALGFYVKKLADRGADPEGAIMRAAAAGYDPVRLGVIDAQLISQKVGGEQREQFFDLLTAAAAQVDPEGVKERTWAMGALSSAYDPSRHMGQVGPVITNRAYSFSEMAALQRKPAEPFYIGFGTSTTPEQLQAARKPGWVALSVRNALTYGSGLSAKTQLATALELLGFGKMDPNRMTDVAFAQAQAQLRALAA